MASFWLGLPFAVLLALLLVVQGQNAAAAEPVQITPEMVAAAVPSISATTDPRSSSVSLCLWQHFTHELTIAAQSIVVQGRAAKAPDPCNFDPMKDDPGASLPKFDQQQSRVAAFYRKHQPEQMLKLHEHLRKYGGNLDKHYGELYKQYCIDKSEL